MDQEKIGKFIKERREELGLTQKDVADKVHVSNKTISKWENGRGLFDITMLKPLSKVLDVSITELVTGELSNEKDFKIKTDDAFNITFQYMNRKEKKVKLKTIILTILIPLIIFMVLNFSYKIYLINRYHEKINNDIVNIIKNKPDEIVSENNSRYNLENMVRYGEVAFINNYRDYEFVKPAGKTKWESYSYIKRDQDGNLISGFRFSSRDVFSYISFLDNVTKEDNKNSDNAKDYVLTKKDIRRILVENDINDDVDLLKYLRKNYYFKSNILMSSKEIKERYSLNKAASLIPGMQNDITYVTGKHKGYIINYKVENIGVKLRELYLIVNNKVYVFDFIGDEFTADEYIKNFIDTTMVDMLSWQLDDLSVN